MKHLKTKLMASAAMLMVATVMISSASFAWFTISTAPEVSDMTTTVVTNENLEIALSKQDGTTKKYAIVAASASGDTGNAYTWGNLIDLDDGSSSTTTTVETNYTNLDKTLRPMHLAAAANSDEGQTAGKFYYPTYGSDGRVSKVNGAISQKYSADGFGNLKGADGNIYGYYVDYWMRSNVGGDLLLTTAVDRGPNDASNASMGSGSYFQASTGSAYAKEALAKAIRISFAVVGTNTTAPGGSTTATSLDLEPSTDPAITVTATTTPDTTDKTKSVFSLGSSEKITTLAANTDTLIRMYVYIEGEAVTNAAASIDDVDTTVNQVKGGLNVQFKITDVNHPMAKTTTSPS